MAVDPRRFDQIERVVRDERRKLDDFKSTVLSRLASHTHSVGVSDHGELTGLTDDDHPQYHNDARGDARYSMGVIARNQRTSNIATSGGIIRTLSTTASVVAGRTYRVSAMFEISPATAGAVSQDELRYTTNNTEPTTTSTVLQRTLLRHGTSAIPDGLFIEAFYHPVTSHTFRVALCITRAIGSGTITLEAGATYPATLTVEDLGESVSETGTDY